MNKIPVFTITGNKKTDIQAPAIFKEKMNSVLLSQALRVYESNKHLISGKAKTRGEVAGSTRKIYRQKGTGGARHGAITAPIFVGGGIAHGPKGIKKTLSLPVKMSKKALSVAFSSKLESGSIAAVDKLSAFKKTKEAAILIDKIAKTLEKSKKRITFVVGENSKSYLALKNTKDAVIRSFKSLNAYDVFYGGLLIFDGNIFKKESEKKIAKKTNLKKAK